MGREELMGVLLQTVRFKECFNWSVAHLLESQFNYNKSYKLVRIGEFLTRNKTQVIVQDDVEYKRVTIKMNNNGVFLRDVKLGKEIGTKKQFRIKEGQFLLSKIDARNGAFGVVTKEVDNAIITGNFWTFDVDYEKIDPHFLSLITTTKQFQRFAQSASSGTTGRHYLDEKKFLDVKIPLPPLEKQKVIVKAYQEKMDLANKQELEAKKKEKEIEVYLYRELGIETEAKKINETYETNHLLKFINYKNLDLWSVYLSQSSLENGISSKFPMVKLSALSPISSGGTPSRSKPEYYTNGEIPWIKTGEVRDKIIYDTEEKITKEALKNSSAKLYPKNSLIIAMYGATAGRTAKLGIEASTNQACAVLYDIDTEKVDIDYLWFYLMTQIENFKSLAAGSAQPNLNAQKIKNFEIPLPELVLQVQIKNTIQMLKNNIEELKEKAQKNRELALQEFEKEIFDEA